ncbi:MAG: UDP-N-acetylmuramoyl-tripeptide--D-alanyl-D-alanine ligase [Firmicutes bacterium]|nr:UDP-N-acetylmuramoyl-tripeptide--D-alanyl-D-alanine ligase [Bacillota bacterium]
MRTLQLSTLAMVSKSKLIGNLANSATSFVIDSRQAFDDTIFVCVKGPNNDGHKYAESAYNQGCRVFVMSDFAACDAMCSAHSDASVIFCDNTEDAFRDMAKWYIDYLGVKKVAVTGSVGKTTTKTLTAKVLASRYNVVSSQKNYNTHLGICMTSFLADENTDIIVYEMGMDHTGEIEGFCSWVNPDTCLITLIADSHLERLGSKEAIADAKLEITKFMSDDKALIYNCDSPFLDKENLIRRTKMNFMPVPVGFGEEASVRIADVRVRGLVGLSFDMIVRDEIREVKLPLLGKHNASNAALAVVCGMIYGIPMKDAADALSDVSGVEKRLASEDVNGVLLLDDSYNANPASMAAALDVLSSVDAKRKIAVLADMYELGSDEREGHIQTGFKAAECADILVAIGGNADLFEQGAKDAVSNTEIIKFSDTNAAKQSVLDMLRSGDAVLVKGSNSTKVSTIAEEIRKLKH